MQLYCHQLFVIALSVFSRVVSRSLPSSHSQSVMTFQSSCSSCRRFLVSRSTLPLILFCQKAVLDFGIPASLQSVCPCQKQPFTKTTIRFFLMTMSGRPGKVVCMRYLIPWLNRNCRTNSSGLVFFPLIRDIFQLRFAGVSLSAISIHILPQMLYLSFNGKMVTIN